jgi:hypothetical protein
MSADLARAIVAELDDQALDELAGLLAPRLAERFEAPAPGGWVETKAAAEHLGISVDAMHRLTAARALTFSQEAPGAKCYFRRSDLDAYREQSTRGR